jgi:hypothetical protein
MATKTAKPAKAATKTTHKAKATKTVAPPAKMSQMSAAERVLADAGEPLNCKAMVEAMSAKGYWTSPGGKTPSATLYASLLRHIQKHGKAARFVKTDRGLFTLASK